jgi:hypothetical protein
MKIAYFVTGPESAGNRLMAALLVRAGCDPIASLEEQHLHVYMRSFEMFTDAFPFERHVEELKRCGYDAVHTLIMTRHPRALTLSQRERHPFWETDLEAELKTRAGYVHVFRALEKLHTMRWWMVPYESLEKGADALVRWIGLEPGSGELQMQDEFPKEIVNQNWKHF